ncbi:GNAT family N-acetyltransferase [Algoriphagus aestuarii]|nr:GNAT family N-acetyltransferase [Algoriphagus aestuarii]
MTSISAVKSFAELSNYELYNILKLRNEVFVVEQNCVYQDADNKDLKGDHLMIKGEDGLLAYARILPPGVSYKEVSIGRVVSHPKARRMGVGKELMKKALEFIQEKYGACRVRISAQTYLKVFYASFGFETVGEVYLEDGIEHVEMVKVI